MKRSRHMGRRYKKVFTLAVALCLLAPAVHAQSLADALSRAYASNPDVRIARSQVLGTDENVNLAVAARRPRVIAFGGVGRVVYETWSFADVSTPSPRERFAYPQNSVGLNLQQPLYAGGSLDAKLAAAHSQSGVVRSLLRQTEQQVLLSAATAYFDVWLATRKMSAIDAHVKHLSRLRDSNESRLRLQMITVTDFGQVQSRLAQAVASHAQAENDLGRARLAYRLVIGADAEPSLASTALPAELPELPASEEMARAEAMASDPGLLAAGQAVDAAGQVVRIAQAQKLPTATLNYAASDGSGVSSEWRRLHHRSVLVSADWQFNLGGAAQAGIEKAEAGKRSAEMAREGQRRGVLEAVSNAWHGYTAAKQVATSWQTQLSAAQVTSEGIDLGVLRGLRSVWDQLNAADDVFNARVGVASASRDITLSGMRLLAAIGKLDPVTMQLQVDAEAAAFSKRPVLVRQWGLN